MGPTLFNIYLADLFMFSMNSTIANYADDNTPYTTANDIESIIYNLGIDSSTLFKWLSSNILIPNPSKSHMLLSCPNLELFAYIDGNKIFNSKREKLLVFILKKNIRYSSKQIFETRNVHSVHNGTETLSYLGPKIWFPMM